VPELAEFNANCSVANGVVTSAVNESHFSFDATILSEILAIPSRGFEGGQDCPRDSQTFGNIQADKSETRSANTLLCQEK